MSNINVAIIYYSSTGTNYRMALAAEEGATQAGAETRLRRVHELAPEDVIAKNAAWKAHYDETKDKVPVATLEDLEWADAIIISTPTRFGNVAAQIKQFLDTTGGLWFQGKLTNKVVTSMTSASNDHGGNEATILALNNTFYHWGAIIVPPGYTDQVIFQAGGNPYGTAATVNEHKQLDENTLAAASYQAKRLVTVAQWVKAGQQEKVLQHQ